MRACCLVMLFAVPGAAQAQTNVYKWLESYHLNDSIAMRITPPEGYSRVTARRGTFGHWLRYLKLAPEGTPVMYHYGRKKRNQKNHAAIIDIDVGEQDLQQCADAVIRLRGEYLYGMRKYGLIHFNFTSGHRADFHRWVLGDRPSIARKTFAVTWKRTAEKDASYRNFRKYLKTIFIYAGSASLNLEMDPVPGVDKMEIGDVFIQGGFPGHAVIVIDLAEHRESGRRIFLLAQSYMPAQSVHILKNPADREGSPWYSLEDGQQLVTPEWRFKSTDLKRFRNK